MGINVMSAPLAEIKHSHLNQLTPRPVRKWQLLHLVEIGGESGLIVATTTIPTTSMNLHHIIESLNTTIW